MRWRPTKFGVFVILLCGVVINVLVAWGFTFKHRGHFGLVVAQFDITQQQRPWPYAVPKGWPRFCDERLVYSEHGYTRTYLFSPAQFQSSPSGALHVMMITKAGFPLKCLSYHQYAREPANSFDWVNDGYQWDAGDGVLEFSSFAAWYETNISPSTIINQKPRLWIPTSPMPLGFTANTLLYAMLIWPIYTLIASRFRPLFPKPGVCRRCEYDVTGLDQCPECGLKVKRRKTKAMPATAMAGEPQ